MVSLLMMKGRDSVEKIVLKSEQLKKDIYAMLKKDDSEELYKYELKEIKKITLRKYNFLEEENAYYFNEIELFENLESISFNQFNISQEIVECINKCRSLKSVTFNHCKFEAEDEVVLDIESLYLTFSDINDLVNFKNCDKIENIEIIECGEIDIKEAKVLNGIKKIEIYNCKITNAMEFVSLEGLEVLKLDGSILDEDIENSIKDNIQYQHKEKFYLIP